MNAKHVRLLFIVFVVIASGIYAGAILTKNSADGHLPPDKVTGEAQLGGPFSLSDQTGQTRTEKDLLGKYAVLYFGYTYCPDICPMGLHSLSAALKQLGDKATHIQPVFITVDPKRDTQKEIKAFLMQFHPSFLGLTGSEEAVEKAKTAYKVYSFNNKPYGDHQQYTVDHSSIIYVMDPKGKFIGHFTHATPAEEMAKKLNEWVK